MTMQSTEASASIGITGATGFIGAHLVRFLRSDAPSWQLRPFVRRETRLPEAHLVSFTDPVASEKAIAGCTAVVHCAFDTLDLPQNMQVSLNIARACARNRAKLIHISTASVYEPLPDGPLDETAPTSQHGSAYKNAKRDIEEVLIRAAAELDFELVILQPSAVYGPEGRAWTDAPIVELLTGDVVLPDDGRGLCNAVYVGDLCRAVKAAIMTPVASGTRILISARHPVTWREFYNAYCVMLGVGRVTNMVAPASVAEQGTASQIPPRKSRGKALKARLARHIGTQSAWTLNIYLRCALSCVRRRQRHIPHGPLLQLFRARCDIRITRARSLLNYEPCYSLEEGMEETAAYARQRFGRLARMRTWLT